MVTLPFPFSHVKATANLAVEGGIQLPLYRLTPNEASTHSTVLLIHGASAGAQTFLLPRGRGFADYLLQQGYDVWLLDWRASCNVAPLYGQEQCGLFTVDHAAEHDFPSALREIRKTLAKGPLPNREIDVLAHCFGAGSFAASIGGGYLHGDLRVRNVVLSTLGLFYEMPWYGFAKADDFILERIRGLSPDCLGIHPAAGPRIYRGKPVPVPDEALGVDAEKHAWPEAMEQAYRIWPQSWLPPWPNSFGHRLAFMFGFPFLKENLADEIYNKDLQWQFGMMHLTLYVQAAQCVRRGFVAPLDDVGDKIHKYLNREPFKNLHVTLVTGAKNSLWHRGSIDRMYEWLLRAGPRHRYSKHVFADYGHQDLFWGQNSEKDVFPTLLAGLRKSRDAKAG